MRLRRAPIRRAANRRARPMIHERVERTEPNQIVSIVFLNGTGLNLIGNACGLPENDTFTKNVDSVTHLAIGYWIVIKYRVLDWLSDSNTRITRVVDTDDH